MLSPHNALASYPITPTHIQTIGTGRIHASFLVTTSDYKYVLQYVGSLYVPTAPDIELVTTHLAEKNIPTPRLVRTNENELVLKDGDAGWRLMSFVPGVTLEGNPSAEQSLSGAQCVAVFHAALAAYSKPLAYHLPHYRDTTYALQRMYDVDASHKSSDAYAACHPLVEEIGTRRKISTTLHALPSRIGHGDLKINNVRFDETGNRAIALVDLDTLGRYPIPLELGDMLRSWCRTPEHTIHLDLWRVIMETYRANAPFMSHDEWSAVPDGFYEITLSLAARYVTDAYEEAWFAHDPAYPSLRIQNIERARMNLALLDDFKRKEDALRTLHS